MKGQADAAPMSEKIQITIEVDRRNPRLCRFTSVRTLYIGTRTVNDKLEAQGLPLAEKLLNTTGVEKLQLIGHLLVVTRTLEREW